MRSLERGISEFEQLTCSKDVCRFNYEVTKHRFAELVSK